MAQLPLSHSTDLTKWVRSFPKVRRLAQHNFACLRVLDIVVDYEAFAEALYDIDKREDVIITGKYLHPYYSWVT